MERTNYLIDTNVAIYYFGLALASDSEKFMDQVLGKRYFISVINRIELLGFKRLNENESKALSSEMQSVSEAVVQAFRIEVN